MGVSVDFVDICDLAALEAKIAESKPGCILMETISNPLLRVADLDRIAELARAAGAALLVDNTFATPLLIRPLEHGANIVVHSVTKFLAGHGDVLGGVIVADAAHRMCVRTLSRTIGPGAGAVRKLSDYARASRHLRCAWSASAPTPVASRAGWQSHPRIERVHYLADPNHPDAAVIRRLLPEGLYGAMVTFEIKDAVER